MTHDTVQCVTHRPRLDKIERQHATQQEQQNDTKRIVFYGRNSGMGGVKAER